LRLSKGVDRGAFCGGALLAVASSPTTTILHLATFLCKDRQFCVRPSSNLEVETSGSFLNITLCFLQFSSIDSSRSLYKGRVKKRLVRLLHILSRYSKYCTSLLESGRVVGLGSSIFLMIFVIDSSTQKGKTNVPQLSFENKHNGFQSSTSALPLLRKPLLPDCLHRIYSVVEAKREESSNDTTCSKVRINLCRIVYRMFESLHSILIVPATESKRDDSHRPYVYFAVVWL